MIWVVSSAVEHCLHTAGVTGSIPVPPTSTFGAFVLHGTAMGTIQKRTDNLRKPTYQAKIRRKGIPALSKTFETRAAAERWIEETEPSLSREPQRDPLLADLT